MSKPHLVGGTLRTVMASEVKRVMGAHSGKSNQIDLAGIELGVTPRTLRIWLKLWPELQGTYEGAMEKVIAALPKARKKRSKKKARKSRAAA